MLEHVKVFFQFLISQFPYSQFVLTMLCQRNQFNTVVFFYQVIDNDLHFNLEREKTHFYYFVSVCTENRLCKVKHKPTPEVPFVFVRYVSNFGSFCVCVCLLQRLMNQVRTLWFHVKNWRFLLRSFSLRLNCFHPAGFLIICEYLLAKGLNFLIFRVFSKCQMD